MSEPGILSSTSGIETFCGKCKEAIVVRKAPIQPDEWPRFCSRCESWFHGQCQRFSRWDGFHCLSCSKLLRDTERYGGGLAASENVGSLEVALLVAVGAASGAVLIWALNTDQWLLVKLLAGLLACPLILPWLGIGAIGLYNELIPTLSDVLPGSAFRTRPSQLEVPKIKLSVAEAREFCAQPLSRRLERTYRAYVKQGAIAIAACGGIVFILVGLIIAFSPRP